MLYRISYNGGRPRPERSDDRGTTWHVAPLPLDAFASVLAVDPRDENSVWATASGLFHSTDGGAHWTKIDGPFGAAVIASALRFDASRRVLHVAYPNHGVWQLAVE